MQDPAKSFSRRSSTQPRGSDLGMAADDTYHQLKRMVRLIEACIVHAHDRWRRDGKAARMLRFDMEGASHRWSLKFDVNGGVTIKQVSPEASRLVCRASPKEVERLVGSAR